MKYDLLTTGFTMVEMVRRERGVPFTQVGDFSGPYPSGDTCILIDVAARLGMKCCYLGTSGDDHFGRVVLDRLEKDGADIQYVQEAKGQYTPVIFVRYDLDGTREYLPIISNSACDTYNPDDVPGDVVAQSKWVHLSGEIISMCSQGQMRKAIEKFLSCISPDSKVSLDPNFVDDISSMLDFFKPFIDRADLILPSEGEASMLVGSATDEEACSLLAAQGKTIALKRGNKGCTVYSGDQCISIPAFHVEEVDPTGCGDSFCAGFIYGMLQEWPLEKVGRFANATGALQATAVGPMEGAKYLQEVLDFIESSHI
jgi:fructokinase